MTDRQKAARSIIRSLVFQVLPAAIAVLTPEALTEWGMPPATAVIVVALAGTLARAMLPQAFTPKTSE